LKNWTAFSWKVFGRANRIPWSYDYGATWKAIVRRELPANHYPGAFVDWDNTPRRGLQHALLVRNFNERAFERGIAAQIDKARKAGAEFLFINAWNEWAEGTYLEPDARRGFFFLETLRRALATQREQ